MSRELDQFLQNSTELIKYLKNNPTIEERDDYIESLNELLDKRIEIANFLNKKHINPFCDGENPELLRKADQYIIKALEGFKNNIKSDIVLLNKSKQDEIKYLDPYNRMNFNSGIYYDGKK